MMGKRNKAIVTLQCFGLSIFLDNELKISSVITERCLINVINDHDEIKRAEGGNAKTQIGWSSLLVL